MKSFEDMSEFKLPRNLNELKKLSGKGDIKLKRIDNANSALLDIKGKYSRNKSDFVLNANLKNVASFRDSELG